VHRALLAALVLWAVSTIGAFAFNPNELNKITLALRERVDSVLILTPLPGSPFFSRMPSEGRLLDRGWDTNDGHHVKFVPRGFTPWGLQRAQVAAHVRFYSPIHVVSRLLRDQLIAFLVGAYAFALNRRWQRNERDYL
jgi:radical SAM superfamily enzyme YgiQ (UPF0313 family)